MDKTYYLYLRNNSVQFIYKHLSISSRIFLCKNLFQIHCHMLIGQLQVKGNDPFWIAVGGVPISAREASCPVLAWGVNRGPGGLSPSYCIPSPFWIFWHGCWNFVGGDIWYFIPTLQDTRKGGGRHMIFYPHPSRHEEGWGETYDILSPPFKTRGRVGGDIWYFIPTLQDTRKGGGRHMIFYPHPSRHEEGRWGDMIFYPYPSRHKEGWGETYDILSPPFKTQGRVGGDMIFYPHPSRHEEGWGETYDILSPPFKTRGRVGGDMIFYPYPSRHKEGWGEDIWYFIPTLQDTRKGGGRHMIFYPHPSRHKEGWGGRHMIFYPHNSRHEEDMTPSPKLQVKSIHTQVEYLW